MTSIATKVLLKSVPALAQQIRNTIALLDELTTRMVSAKSFVSFVKC